jgi:dTDP-4-dehydrorhamnose reductase
LAQQIEKLMVAGQQGIFHAAGEGYGSWYEVARIFFEEMCVSHHLVQCTTAQYPTPAKRPANSILENKRLQDNSLCIMKNWQDDLRAFVRIYREDLLQEATASLN